MPPGTNLKIEEGADPKGTKPPKIFEISHKLASRTNLAIKKGTYFQKSKLPKIFRISRELSTRNEFDKKMRGADS